MIHFLVIYSCFTSSAIPSKSSFRTIFIENVLVHEAVTAEIVLRPLDHFLVNEITNLPARELHELIAIVVSLVLQEVTPGHLIGSSNVSVVRSE